MQNCEEMDITIDYVESCLRELKRLSKKYRSLPDDMEILEEKLKENPTLGIDLGHNLRKIRLAITSKGKGKSGGARVITYVLVYNDSGIIRFLAIYDKSECSNITDRELTTLIGRYKLK